MKKSIFLLLSTLVFMNIGYTQSSNTDAPPLPPPPRPPCILLSINLPCCVDRFVYTKEIANASYNRSHCEAVFSPGFINPAAQPLGEKKISITATLNGVSITREVLVVNTQPSRFPIKSSFKPSSLRNPLRAIFSSACSVGGCDVLFLRLILQYFQRIQRVPKYSNNLKPGRLPSVYLAWVSAESR